MWLIIMLQYAQSISINWKTLYLSFYSPAWIIATEKQQSNSRLILNFINVEKRQFLFWEELEIKWTDECFLSTNTYIFKGIF